MLKFNYLVLRWSSKVKFVTLCVILWVIFDTCKFHIFFGKELITAHNLIVERFFQNRQSWELSNLGNVLYKNEEYPILSEEKKNKVYLILFWKHWENIKQRHVYHYSDVKHDPLIGCSVQNCNFTGDSRKLPYADAVIVHLQYGMLPSAKGRRQDQRWIFLSDEAPPNAFFQAKHSVPLGCLYSIFNWSMSYASDSDIPVPYGRTVALKKPKFLYPNPPIEQLVPNWTIKRHGSLIAILISNCLVKYRNDVILELDQYVQVHVLGKCNKDVEWKAGCPGRYVKECRHISHYLFYLVLENAKCKEYMSEKLFHNAYSKGAIPIIQGPSLEDCKTFLPPNSFLHVDSYPTLKDLANDVKRISKDKQKILSFHKWRNHFQVLNEHGYFNTTSFHLCRVCEAMNYNDDMATIYSKRKIYQYLSSMELCRDLENT